MTDCVSLQHVTIIFTRIHEEETMAGDSGGNSSGPGRRSKVARVIEERDLDGLGAELERRWVEETEGRFSLRDLATYFNRQVLEAALREADVSVLAGEVENFYGLLTDDDVTAGTRVEAERRLERAGIDVEELRADFVTHQAIHSYLRKHRGVDAPDRHATSSMDDRRDTLEQLRSRTQAVTRTTLESLQRSGDLSIGEFETFVEVRVTCTDCGTRYTVSDLIEAGGCQCD